MRLVPPDDIRSIPPHIAADRIKWKSNARLFTSLHYSLGILAIVTSVIGSVKVDQNDSRAWLQNAVSLSRLVAAMCTASVTFLKLEKTARAYRTAFDRLDRACGKFENGERVDLQKAYDAACKIRDSGEF